MSVDLLSRGGVARPALATGATLALLTIVTHAANLGFTVAAGRLLAPDDFATLTALLGVVLLGMAPGMALQSLTAANLLGRPAVVDRRVAWRMAGIVAATVVAVLVVARPLWDGTDAVTIVAITSAAALLPLTAANEGVLQGRGRFVALGGAMIVGAGTKLVVGTAGMWAGRTLVPAALGITAGYLAQVATSRRLSGGLPPGGAARAGGLISAVGLVGLLLITVHADAVLAQAVLAPEQAGRYAVGVVATRITFWLPQFALLLAFPRLVRDRRGTAAVAAAGVLAGLGLVLAVAAGAVGRPVVDAVFGARFAPIGSHLWRFVWLGAADLGLQVLVLSDLARGRRGSAGVLAAALLGVATAVAVLRPGGAVAVVTLVAVLHSGLLVAGLVRGLVAGTPTAAAPGA